MSKSFKVLSLALGVLLLGALGVGVALAADPPTNATSPMEHQKVFMCKVAKILGIDEQKLTDAVAQANRETRNEMIDQALAEGRITQEWADWMKQRPDEGGFGPGGRGMMRGGKLGGRMGGPLGGPWQPAPPLAPTQ